MDTRVPDRALDSPITDPSVIVLYDRAGRRQVSQRAAALVRDFIGRPRGRAAARPALRSGNVPDPILQHILSFV